MGNHRLHSGPMGQDLLVNFSSPGETGRRELMRNEYVSPGEKTRLLPRRRQEENNKEVKTGLARCLTKYHSQSVLEAQTMRNCQSQP